MTAKEATPWVIRGTTLVVIILLVVAWNMAHTAQGKLTRELEREKLEKAQLLAERDATKKEMKAQEASFLKEHPDLKPELERLQKLLEEKPKIVEVVRWKTKVVEIASDPHDAPRPCPPLDENGKPKQQIILVEGDTGHAEVGELTYQTRAGNKVILGTASCFRDTPTPRKLFESTIEAPVSSAFIPTEAYPKGWGGGLLGTFDKNGWAAGPKILFPTFPLLFGLQGEGDAGFSLGPSGNYVFMASIGARK